MHQEQSNFKRTAILKCHKDWVTCISTTQWEDTRSFISSSRDGKLVVWRSTDDKDVALPQRSLTGHSQAVEDCAMSSDGKFAITASWDKTLRLWDLTKGKTVRSFVGHTGDVLSVTFSPDNRQIVSGSRDKSIKLWNTLAECKFTVTDGGHTDWVSCVRFSPATQSPLIVSCGWDKLVKVWDLQKCVLRWSLVGHSNVLSTVAISPDGSLCASGGKDGSAMLWDANKGLYLSSLDASSPINCLCYAPTNYWLCAATDDSIKIWNLEKSNVIAMELKPDTPVKSGTPWCTSLCWSQDGQTLLAGTKFGEIYVYENEPVHDE